MNTAIQARCERAVPEVGGVKVFTLRAQGAHAGFLSTLQPGRHVAIHYPDTTGTLQERLYSITRRQDDDLFEIAVKRSGRSGVSDQLHSTLQEGAMVPLNYVAGDISLASIVDLEHVGMVAGGIGITLPIALLRELATRSRSGLRVPEVVLMLCVPRVVDIPFLHELLELDLTMAWFSLRVFVTRECIQDSGHFMSGRPPADALHILKQPQAVVICGSHAFAQSFRERTATIFPAARLLIESFTPPEAPTAAEVRQGEAAAPLRLRLADSDAVIEASPGKSLLDMLESGGVPVRSQCRAGICGSCRVRVSAGDCRFEPDFCLSDDDKEDGYALACCTFPLSGELTVDLKSAA